MRQSITEGVLIDHYQIKDLIGSGSMGDVYRALDTKLNRLVALKILSPKHRQNEELHARFTREGRAVAAISHPHVVQVFSTGEYDRRPYIAMELLVGEDLGSIVKRQGPLARDAAAKAIHHAALGLQGAAQAGVIHRDVKPSNLVMLKNGDVKVTDFGLAKPMDPQAEPALTALGVVVGTPDYIAPEQARGESLDERADIYALGGTLYFLLTGSPPYRTGVAAEDKYLKVVARHLKNPVPNALDRAPQVDRGLAGLAQTMMAKKRRARPSYPQVVSQCSSEVSRPTPHRTEPINSLAPTFPEHQQPRRGGTSPLIIGLVALSLMFFLTGLFLFLSK